MRRLIIAALLMAAHMQVIASAYVSPAPDLVAAKLEDNQLYFSFASMDGKSYELELRHSEKMKEAVRKYMERYGFAGNYLSEKEPMTRPTVLFVISINQRPIPCEEKWQYVINIEAKLMRPVTFPVNGIFHEIEVTVFEEFGQKVLPPEDNDIYPRLIRELETRTFSIMRVIEASNKPLVVERAS